MNEGRTRLSRQHTWRATNLTKLGSYVDELTAGLEEGWYVESVDIETDVHNVYQLGGPKSTYSIRYTATVITTNGDKASDAEG